MNYIQLLPDLSAVVSKTLRVISSFWEQRGFSSFDSTVRNTVE
jgi:hypothetical protein